MAAVAGPGTFRVKHHASLCGVAVDAGIAPNTCNASIVVPVVSRLTVPVHGFNPGDAPPVLQDVSVSIGKVMDLKWDNGNKTKNERMKSNTSNET